jgi:hypothetical protein
MGEMAKPEPVTTGSNPEPLQITVTLQSYASTAAFRDWLMSGDATRAFWQWCSMHGRYV